MIGKKAVFSVLLVPIFVSFFFCVFFCWKNCWGNSVVVSSVGAEPSTFYSSGTLRVHIVIARYSLDLAVPFSRVFFY